jgi:hypothetical protein
LRRPSCDRLRDDLALFDLVHHLRLFSLRSAASGTSGATDERSVTMLPLANMPPRSALSSLSTARYRPASRATAFRWPD